MPIVTLRVPQLGEGLQEALLVEFLKRPGDQVSRDEPIYVMETDKATTDVESPYTGKLVQWLVSAGQVLAIGAEIANIETDETTDTNQAVREAITGPDLSRGAGSVSAANSSSHNDRELSTAEKSVNRSAQLGSVLAASLRIPPRTRQYLKDHQLLDQVDQIPVTGKKMTTQDVDVYLEKTKDPSIAKEIYAIVPLSKSQIALNFRLSRSAAICIPATMVADINWSAIEKAREHSRAANGPSSLALACWAIVQALRMHAPFRSSLTADGRSLKIFHHVNLGIAVALPGDQLVTAVIHAADQLNGEEFFAAYEKQVSAAQNGRDQADETTTMLVSSISKFGIRLGIPAIVAPAVATLALGEVFPMPRPDGEGTRFQPTVSAALTFDHRIVNGVGAAKFLGEVRHQLENFSGG